MEKLYTRKEAAAMLGISCASLDVMRNAGKIAYIRYTSHGRVFYTEESLKAVMEKSTHKEPPCEMFETYRKRRD